MRRFLPLLLACPLLAILLPAALRAQPTDADRRVAAFVAQRTPDWLALYRELHANPEIAFGEKNTSATITARLRALGYQVTDHFGGYGVVGILRNGNGPTVLVRTDLDALPVEEQTGLPYASKVRVTDENGREVSAMHACGHDLHMSVFVGTAQTLAQFADAWRGTLVLIGQPAEERSGGAKAMLKEGLFTRFPRPDYCLALHTHAGLPAGQVGYTEGPVMANVDAVDITVRGVGGHGAAPQGTRDPIVLAAQIIGALQTIVSRENSPFQPCVVTVGSIHGGTQFNIIPDEVKLQLTLRSYADEVRNRTIASIERICQGLAQAAGVPKDRLPTVTVRDQFTPFTDNDVTLTRRLAAASRRAIGTANVVVAAPSMVGEDFSFFGRQEPRIPLCMYWLGGVDPQKLAASQRDNLPLPTLHSATFAPLPEPALQTGVKTMVAAVMELLPKK